MGRKWKECLGRGRSVEAVRPRRNWVPRASMQLSTLMLRYPFAAGLAAGGRWSMALPPRKLGEAGREVRRPGSLPLRHAGGPSTCSLGARWSLSRR